KLIEEVSARLKIGIRPFQRTKRRVLIDRLLFDPRVQEATAAFAKSADISARLAQSIVEKYAKETVPAFNAYLYFRIGYWIGRRVAQTLYRVRLGYVDSEGLAKMDPDATVVFVMNHRSNMDYVLAGYLAADQAALSYAVGEWARIWPLSHLIRSMGAYFVRRNSKDDLYRKVLERYIAMATEAGVPQAVFPEGGLSRDGRMREPRLGVLDYMMRGFKTDGERDVVFIPLGINYDRVLEDRTLLLSINPEAGIQLVKQVVLVHQSVAKSATVFVRHSGRSLSMLEMKAEIEAILDDLDAANAHVYVPRRDLDYALDAGLRMLLLRHLVDEYDGLYSARLEELQVLRYYANSIAHLLPVNPA
ncbi:MAG: glycerol-3-phosphate acyltransferase, partial [Betaproteobacteria bacterium]|nr:glycerol-3-phosphate acyltransferase [Betaproteobacteria bacterium]